MAQIKIRVATHDNDTTDIQLSRNGTKLNVSLGDKTADIDMAEFIPATQADRFLADASYDEVNKELILITRKEGEEDKELRVPISHLFQVEVEEVFSTGEGVYFNPSFSANNIGSVNALGVGRIKGTDWYVFKFNETDMANFKTKLDAERAKRDSESSDVTTDDSDLEEYNYFSTDGFVEPNTLLTTQDNGDGTGTITPTATTSTFFKDITRYKQSSLPTSFQLRAQDEDKSVLATYQAVRQSGVITHYELVGELRSMTFSERSYVNVGIYAFNETLSSQYIMIDPIFAKLRISSYGR